MILADSSLWVDHLRSSSRELAGALTDGEVLGHPHVTGELACGNLRNRATVLQLLRDLPQAVLATEEEALECIERNRLYGRGLGWTDVHLLASALLTPARLWTLDVALAREARRCGVTLDRMTAAPARLRIRRQPRARCAARGRAVGRSAPRAS